MERVNLPAESDCLGVFRISGVIYVFNFISMLFYVGLLFVLLQYFESVVNLALNVINNSGFRIRSQQSLMMLMKVFDVIFYILTAIFSWGILKCFYDFLALKNTIIFVDEQGVWLHKGVFSWQKEINGVYWADASMAKSRNSFFGLFFNAYPVILLNRYTGNVEIFVRHIKDGKKAITLINERVEKNYNQNSR